MAQEQYPGQDSVQSSARSSPLVLTAGDDSNDLASGICKAFYCTADSTLTFVAADGTTTPVAVPVGAYQIVPQRVLRLKSTGTNLNSGKFVALY